MLHGVHHRQATDKSACACAWRWLGSWRGGTTRRSPSSATVAADKTAAAAASATVAADNAAAAAGAVAAATPITHHDNPGATSETSATGTSAFGRINRSNAFDDGGELGTLHA